MKKIISICLLLIMGMGAAISLQAQGQNNDNALIGKAHASVGSCVGQAHPLPGNGNGGNSNSGIQSEVNVVGTCIAGGDLKRVSFYYIEFGPPCIPSEEDPCHPPLPLFVLIATVDFDCAGNIVASACYN